MAANRSFDEEPLPDLDSEAIDFRAASEFFASIRSLTRQHLSVDDILSGISKLRNRVIGRVFKELGLIEQWGSGIGRMRSTCREADLPEPRFEEIGRHFLVTLFKHPGTESEADELEQAVLDLLADGQGHTTAEVARIIGRTPRAARTRLAGLVTRGLVSEVGTNPRDPKRKYYLAAKER